MSDLLLTFHIQQYRGEVELAFKSFMVSHKENIKDIMLKLSLGEAPGKSEYSQCLLKTVDRSSCAYPSRESCVGCEYSIKETYFLLELNQKIQEKVSQIQQTSSDFDSKRYMHTLMYVYIPIIQEAIQHFGKERVRAFVKFSKQDIMKLREHNKQSIGVNQKC